MAHYEFMGPTQPSAQCNKTFIHLSYAQARFSQWLIQTFKTSPPTTASGVGSVLLSKRSFLSRNSSHLPWTSPCMSGVERATHPFPPTSLRGREPCPSLRDYSFPAVLRIIPMCSLSLLHLDYFPQVTPFPFCHQTCSGLLIMRNHSKSIPNSYSNCKGWITITMEKNV